MPYIKQEDRERLAGQFLDGFLEPKNAGELNFLFTVLSHGYWDENGRNYQAFNDIIGALEGAKLELYRRRVAPYEDLKIKENGDAGV